MIIVRVINPVVSQHEGYVEETISQTVYEFDTPGEANEFMSHFDPETIIDIEDAMYYVDLTTPES